MKKILLGIGVLLFLLLFGKFAYEVYKNVGSRFLFGALRAVSGAGLARQYPKTIKGVLVSTPGIEKQVLRQHAEDMKEMGINTVQIILGTKKDADGHFYPSMGVMPRKYRLNYYKNLIAGAKGRGFAVWVAYANAASGMRYPHDLTFESKEEWEKELRDGAIEIAKILEDYHVEYYSPLVEPDLVLVNNGVTGDALKENLTRLAEQIHPQVKRVFNGRIIAKVTEARVPAPQPFTQHPDFEEIWAAEATGADILGLDVLPPFQGVDRYRQMIKEQFVPASKVSAKRNIPWLVAEYAQGEGGVTGIGQSWDTQALQIVFEEFLSSRPRPIGLSFNFWNFVEGEKNRRVKEAFREFFTKLSL